MGRRPGHELTMSTQTPRLERFLLISISLLLIASGIAPVVHDVSDGGLAVAVAEICINSRTGATVAAADWRLLFSESPHRFVAVIDPERRNEPIVAERKVAHPASINVGVPESQEQRIAEVKAGVDAKLQGPLELGLNRYIGLQ